MSRGLPFRNDRSDEQVRAEQELVIKVARGRIVLMVEDQRALDGRAGLRCLQEAGVNVGHQPVALADGCGAELLDGGSE